MLSLPPSSGNYLSSVSQSGRPPQNLASYSFLSSLLFFLLTHFNVDGSYTEFINYICEKIFRRRDGIPVTLLSDDAPARYQYRSTVVIASCHWFAAAADDDDAGHSQPVLKGTGLRCCGVDGVMGSRRPFEAIIGAAGKADAGLTAAVR